jgi:FMN reductase
MARLTVISGGLRDPSSTRLLAGRLEAAVRTELQALNVEADSTFVELRPLGRPIMDEMLTGLTSAALEAAFESVADADGVIAVTPAFNASFSGLFKSFFDVLPEEALSDMPVLIAATGGTERHSLVLEHALRPMFSYLHAIVSPTGVYAATDDFGAQEGSALRHRIRKAAADFARLMHACGTHQRRDVFAEELLSIERLLGDPSARISSVRSPEGTPKEAIPDG